VKEAMGEWPDLNIQLEDNVYAGAGHVFSPDMVRDALRFIVDAIAADEKASSRVPLDAGHGPSDRPSKI